MNPLGIREGRSRNPSIQRWWTI